MTHPLVLSSKAKDDLVHASNWYRVQRDGLDHEFMMEVSSRLSTIAAFPKGAPLAGRTLRFMPLSRFPFVISYRFTGARVLVVRVVHGRRHPSVRKR